MCKLQPYETKTVACITQQNPRAGFALSYSWNVGTEPPDDATLQRSGASPPLACVAARSATRCYRECEDHDREVLELYKGMDSLQLERPASSIPLQDIRDLLASKQVVFVDKEFPPMSSRCERRCASLLVCSQAHNNGDCVSVSVAPAEAGPIYGKWVTWRRAQEFMADGLVRLFEDGISPLDIQQVSSTRAVCFFFATLLPKFCHNDSYNWSGTTRQLLVLERPGVPR